ncbi:unnamed protein product [marine sediment metagenome]|uniref:Uncharacterized protein n=1 Tax=marine sediment metagenome TaxID=412755 RepID=X0ZG25_9ZZZZ
MNNIESKNEPGSEAQSDVQAWQANIDNLNNKLSDLSRKNISAEDQRVKDLEKEKNINKYLIENLPDSEERLVGPMDPNCEVSVVIPVYGERDFFFRPLESLTEQKGMKADQFEAIFVVNNPGTEPVREAEETEDDYQRKVEHFHKAVLENQETINIPASFN